MRKLTSLVLLLGVGLLLAPAISSAVPVTFFGQDLGLGEGTPLPSHPISDAARASFFANLSGVGTETFESYGAGTGAPLPIAFSGAGTATLLGNGSIATVTPGTTNGFGRYAISGSNYWESSDVFSISFSDPIAAFGFYGVDIGDFAGQLKLHMTGGGTVDLTVPNGTNIAGGSVLYYGFYDLATTYTAIDFGNTAPGVDFFAFDNMSVGSLRQVNPVVPEPGTLMLVGAGLAGLARIRSRKKSSK